MAPFTFNPLSWRLFSFISQRAGRVHVKDTLASPSESIVSSPSTRSSVSSASDTQNVLRDIILDYLARIHVPFPQVTYDRDFEAACCNEITRRGYILESLRPFLPGGVVMATTSYSHLEDVSARIYIALYTGYLIYLDDVFEHDVTAVEVFNDRFVSHRKQKDPVLDDFADLLRRAPKLWPNKVVSNLIITSTLNLVTALLLENQTRDMRLRSVSCGYPTFSRVMSGASEAYGLFIFPANLPLPSFIQALPELMVYINNGNDILSFYKEEASGETVNRVSWLAQCHGYPKLDAVRELLEEAVMKREQILLILKPSKEACNAFLRFTSGYIGFHAGLKRYRLGELDL
ncbi:hypothetical protein D9758_009124 [Tetrapyrgos nigripes]|uniref:Terpenoid synthase n=1 Tax=Tetrapyrgos nigripes TaxID=182062 RepID=A0A8H5G8H3_9AGAR|nr:hypothetical protein D9758_009124 [Tetrapyrgos nigripes]